MIILQSLYFALPMYIANMVPVIFKWLPFLDCPLDAGKNYRGHRVFGKNKTWRGLVLGTIFGLLTVQTQHYFYLNNNIAQSLSLLSYDSIDIVSLGLLMGFGALFGDAVKSFFKRQLGRPSGSAWPPFDQLDFVVFALVFSSFVYFPGWEVILILLLFSPLLHALTNFVSYHLGIKEVPW